MKKLFVLFLLLLIAAGCNENKVVKLDNGITYMEDTLGTGAMADSGSFVSIHFDGWVVKDSTNLFDDWSKDSTRIGSSIGSSKTHGQPVKYKLGSGTFIKGIDAGIVGMKVGGTRTIVVPSELGYGQQGMGPVPPNTDMKIIIELIEVKAPVIVKKWDADSTKYQTTKSGLKYVIISEGTGDKADSGKTVTVHYTGYLESGKIFDSSVERDDPITFMLGQGMVIPGWEEGLKLLNKGAKAKLVIPASLAYGSVDRGEIPANSTLIFDVELVDVK
ncbi:MAG: FKBP-type peptidyl-prolyl cis-trans isomerase [Ignavibacteriaceae bacterium]|nr:FKBP-type peptidyl-prolyl cis-trans isomerase [Ignavibacteriaceae bacterium]